jgi:RNA polymerase-interacting CarD/CdnL/TRCF family regulator
MSQKTVQFSKDDWIVHLHYGVGQVKRIEKKQMGDKKTSYYRVETPNSTFWVPVDTPNKERVRAISSKYKIRKALNILKESPVTLAEDHNERKRQINEAMAEISIDSGAQLLRDLSARQAVHKLNPTEEKALDLFIHNFILEWSVAMDTDIEKIRERFQEVLHDIKSKVK